MNLSRWPQYALLLLSAIYRLDLFLFSILLYSSKYSIVFSSLRSTFSILIFYPFSFTVLFFNNSKSLLHILIM